MVFYRILIYKTRNLFSWSLKVDFQYKGPKKIDIISYKSQAKLIDQKKKAFENIQV